MSFNKTSDLFTELGKKNDFIPIITIASISLLFYLCLSFASIISLIGNKGYLCLCCYKLKSKNQERKLRFTHILLFSILTGTVYKIITTSIIISNKINAKIGSEILSFILFDVFLYDIHFGLILLIYSKVINGILFTSFMKKIIMIVRVIVLCIFILSLLNAVYTSLVSSLVQDIQLFGILIYVVCIPLLVLNKLVLLSVAIFFTIFIINHLRQTNDKINKISSIKLSIVLSLFIVSNLSLILFLILCYFYGLLLLLIFYFIRSEEHTSELQS